MVKNSSNLINSVVKKPLSLKKSRFTGMLIEENSLDQSGFERWIFCNGMLFNSPDKWWGDRGLRDYPHEGIDLCLYKDRSGMTRRIDETTRIPAMQGGEVKAIFKDYLGKVVIIEHEYSDRDNGTLISFYAHTNPHAQIEVGVTVKEGDIIATLADTSNAKANIMPHLHLSLGIPSKSLTYDGFIWNILRDPDMITPLDPLGVIDWPYQTLGAESPDCRGL